MCVTSAVMDQYRPYFYFPNPNIWDPQYRPNTQPPTQPWPVPVPVPTVPWVSPAPTFTPEDIAEATKAMKELIESFRKAVDAAEVFDRLTGQPDCVDPEKGELMDRVDALEARIAELETEKEDVQHPES
jgi:hypothetical protein